MVICTRNRPAALRGCLMALAQQRVRPDEILVVDNAAEGEDAAFPVVGRFGGVRVVRERRTGIVPARNHGWNAACGDLIAFLDDDCRPHAEWLFAVTNVFRERPDVGCVTGPVLPVRTVSYAQRLMEHRGGFSRGATAAEFSAVESYTVQAWRLGTGGNMTFRRRALEGIGGFDPALPTGEDIDALHRLVRQGWTLRYEPAARVLHCHVADLREFRKRLFRWGWAYAAFLAKTAFSEPVLRSFALRELMGVIRYHAVERFWPSFRGRQAFPPALVIAEMAGLFAGAFGFTAKQLTGRVATVKKAAGTDTPHPWRTRENQCRCRE